MTSGNHIWDKKEALDYIGTEPRLLRPINYPAGVPGNGSYIVRTRNDVSVGVINAMGRVFMLNIDDPFTVVAREVAKPIRNTTLSSRSSSMRRRFSPVMPGRASAVSK